MKGTILILSALLLFGCSETPESRPSKRARPLVFVSIPPQAGLLKAMVGEHIEVRTLVGEGQSPHSYEPTARQLTALGEADILFTIGVPFEQALLTKIAPLYPDLKIVESHEGIGLRSMPHNHDGVHCTHDHGEKDPHVWLTPLKALKIASNMRGTLKKLYSDHYWKHYHSNFEALNMQLNHLHEETAKKLLPFRGKRFYVFHPSFGYFSDAYGLEQIAVELNGKSPTPRQLAKLIEQAKADGVKVIFVQKQFPSSSAKVISDAIGGSVVQLDPLAEDSVANLRRIAESIAQTLEP
jgi:zinc transport system substrate-binding protein